MTAARDAAPAPAALTRAERRRAAVLAATRKDIARRAFDRAETRLRRHLAADPASDPDCGAVRYALAGIAVRRIDLADASGLLLQVAGAAPMAREPVDLLAVVFGLAGQVNSAVYYGKLAVSLSPDPAFEGLLPDGIPTFATVLQAMADEPLLNQAMAALGRDDLFRAEYWFRQHLAFVDSSVPAWIGLATTLKLRGQHRAALDTVRAARHAVPDDPALISLMGQALAAVGDFAAARVSHRLATRRAPEDSAAAAAALVDGWHEPHAAVSPTVEGIRQWGRRFGARGQWIVPQAPASPSGAPMAGAGGRLTVGVVVGGESHQDWAPFLAAILAGRRRERFATVGFGYGDLDRGGNRPFQRSFDRWRDIAGIDAMTLQTVIASDRVDILLNVAGFSAPALLAIHGARIAPCQIGWLGSPFGTGLAEIDFQITDRFVCERPDTIADRPLYLDLGCVLTDPPAPAAAVAVRAPGQPVVFAADAGLAAIEPLAVAAWAAVLERVPGSTLLLRDHDLSAPANLALLTDRFGDHGLSHRVDLVDTDPAGLFAEADVVLMPFGRADPRTVVDALAAGRPPVCPAGTGPFARRAASVLHHLGFGAEMIAADIDDYVAKAVAWAAASGGDGHQAWQADVARALATARVFDPQARAADLATALETAWSRTNPVAAAGTAGCAA